MHLTSFPYSLPTQQAAREGSCPPPACPRATTHAEARPWGYSPWPSLCLAHSAPAPVLCRAMAARACPPIDCYHPSDRLSIDYACPPIDCLPIQSIPPSRSLSLSRGPCGCGRGCCRDPCPGSGCRSCRRSCRGSCGGPPRLPQRHAAPSRLALSCRSACRPSRRLGAAVAVGARARLAKSQRTRAHLHDAPAQARLRRPRRMRACTCARTRLYDPGGRQPHGSLPGPGWRSRDLSPSALFPLLLWLAASRNSPPLLAAACACACMQPLVAGGGVRCCAPLGCGAVPPRMRCCAPLGCDAVHPRGAVLCPPPQCCAPHSGVQCSAQPGRQACGLWPPPQCCAPHSGVQCGAQPASKLVVCFGPSVVCLSQAGHRLVRLCATHVARAHTFPLSPSPSPPPSLYRSLSLPPPHPPLASSSVLRRALPLSSHAASETCLPLSSCRLPRRSRLSRLHLCTSRLPPPPPPPAPGRIKGPPPLRARLWWAVGRARLLASGGLSSCGRVCVWRVAR
jgi:hypothetical protein